MRGQGGGGSQPIVQLCIGAQISFRDLTPFLTFGSQCPQKKAGSRCSLLVSSSDCQSSRSVYDASILKQSRIWGRGAETLWNNGPEIGDELAARTGNGKVLNIWAVLWIRIHWIRIRIQHFKWIRIRIRTDSGCGSWVLMTKDWKKYSWRMFFLFSRFTYP